MTNQIQVSIKALGPSKHGLKSNLKSVRVV